MGRLFEECTSLRSLTAGWQEVLANDAEDGTLQASIVRFREDAEQRLQELADDLASATYRPQDLTEIRIPKADGTHRVLHVPSVTDRIVERAVLEHVTPLIDPLLGGAAFGFRPGLGVRDAVQRVAHLREEGRGWVAHADVHDCFPSVDVPRVLGLLRPLIEDEAVFGLVEALQLRCAYTQGGRRPIPGLPQGSPLSPLLSNLALVAFDDGLQRVGLPLVRYADDFVIVCRTEADAHRALVVARELLEGISMTLAVEKTEVMSFEQGFCFLGEDFGVRYPPALDEARIQEPSVKTLFVGRQGTRVRVSSGRVVVQSKDDAELVNVPLSHVARIVLFGSVGLSAGAREWALKEQVPVIFLSRRGSYQGQLLSSGGKKRMARITAQVQLGEPEQHRIAAAVVVAKLTKQTILVKHFMREEHADGVRTLIDQIDLATAMCGEATTVSELLGLEGAGAKAYFEAWRVLVPEELGFSGRNRQPPLDVPNAALSYLYTVLLGEATAAIVAAGLDPAWGCLHTDARNKPALALDLMEEFRPLIVDQVVLEAIRGNRITPQSGTSVSGKPGVFLTKAAKQQLLEGYERRMVRVTKGALPGFAGSYRRHLYRQAQRLCAAISGGEEFTGLSWR